MCPPYQVRVDGTKTVHLSLQINGEDLQEDYMDYDNSVSSERQCLEWLFSESDLQSLKIISICAED